MKYVLYHENCMDGFAAAYAAYCVLGDSAQYIPVNYGNPVPDVLAADEIYILDFSYSRSTLEGLVFETDKLVVLDHHKTAQEQLEGFPFAQFDMNKSGCVMAWEHFHTTPVPELFKYIQDRDLWTWKLAESQAVNAYLRTICEPCGDFLKFDFLVNSNINDFKDYGAIVLKVEENIIKRCMKHVHLRHYSTLTADYDIWSVNSPILQSEIGNELAKKYGYGDVYYYVENPSENPDKNSDVPQSKIRHSLRSIGDIDVSVIAKAFGGGGHKNAAGFES